jgi:hypothetical protein
MLRSVGIGEGSGGMNTVMDLRRSHWLAAVRLAVIVSAIAVAVTLALTAFGDVSQTALVIAVIVVGFVVSWIHSGRETFEGDEPAGGSASTSGRGGDGHASHRVSVVRVHHHTG